MVTRLLDTSASMSEAQLSSFIQEILPLTTFPISNAKAREIVEAGEIDQDSFDLLYDFYLNAGDMPYGVAKARDGDPYDWIVRKLGEDFA